MQGREKDSNFLSFLKRKYSNKRSWGSQQQVSAQFKHLARNWFVLLIIIFLFADHSSHP